MKKKQTKFLAFVLTVIMLLSSLPMSAFAVTMITTITCTDVVTPIVGKEASYDWDIPTGKGYIMLSDANNDTCWWVETTSKVTSYSDIEAGVKHKKSDATPLIFRSDRYYTFVGRFGYARTGYAYSSTLTATLNGSTASVKKGDAPYGPDVWYCFGRPLNEITDIYVTDVTAPVEGNKANFNWTIPETKGYKKYIDEDNDSCCWVETKTPFTSYSDINSGTQYFNSASPLTFRSDRYYTFVCWIGKAIDTYIYAPSVKGKVNGNAGATQTASHGLNPSARLQNEFQALMSRESLLLLREKLQSLTGLFPKTRATASLQVKIIAIGMKHQTNRLQ